MLGIRRALMGALLASGLILGLDANSVQASPYDVDFVNGSWSITPRNPCYGKDFTIGFTVNNKLRTIRHVSIKLVQPADSKGQGRTVKRLFNVTLRPGETSFSLTGTLGKPTFNSPYFIVWLHDYTDPRNPVIITQSGASELRQTGPNTWCYEWVSTVTCRD